MATFQGRVLRMVQALTVRWASQLLTGCPFLSPVCPWRPAGWFQWSLQPQSEATCPPFAFRRRRTATPSTVNVSDSGLHSPNSPLDPKYSKGTFSFPPWNDKLQLPWMAGSCIRFSIVIPGIPGVSSGSTAYSVRRVQPSVPGWNFVPLLLVLLNCWALGAVRE